MLPPIKSSLLQSIESYSKVFITSSLLRIMCPISCTMHRVKYGFIGPVINCSRLIPIFIWEILMKIYFLVTAYYRPFAIQGVKYKCVSVKRHYFKAY
jgi:hypothetical protein